VDYVVVGFDPVSYCTGNCGWLCDLVGSLARELRTMASINKAKIAASDATEMFAGGWHFDLIVPYLPRFQKCRSTVARPMRWPFVRPRIWLTDEIRRLTGENITRHVPARLPIERLQCR
jgi:hypothetical protein